jgi:diaminopimelate decarboxylase
LTSSPSLRTLTLVEQENSASGDKVISENSKSSVNKKLVDTRTQPVSRAGVAGPKFSDEDLYSLSEKYGTPYFLIDEATLRRKVDEIEQGFAEFKGAFSVAFSVKANFNPSVIKTFANEEVLFDLTAPSELVFTLRSGGRAENIVYTSITETVAEYEEVLRMGVRMVVVASYLGLLNLIEAAGKANVVVKTMVRVNPEVHVHAELHGSMGHGKFGLQFNGANQDSAFFVLRKILDSSRLKFEGFHFHLGSQIEDPSCYAEAIEKLESFVLDARRQLGQFPVRTIDIGGGLPASYGRRVPSPKDLGSKIVGQLNSLMESFGEKFTLIAESGRFLTAESTVLVSRIVNVKSFGESRYVYIDAGYHVLLDAALLRHEYPVEVVPGGKQSLEKVVLVGRLCDPLDVFPTSSRSKLGGAEPGKLVVFRDVGAYSLVMNMPFHSQPRPFVLLRTGQGEFVVARRGRDVDRLFEEEGGDCLPP